jgi:aspartate/methionine/tyrosine aminotransferase
LDSRKLLNSRFSQVQGGLFASVDKADVGDGVGKLRDQGVDILAWADPFFPDPSIPPRVKETMIQALEEGFPSHYSMPIGMEPLRKALASHVSQRTGLHIDPQRNIIVTPGSDSGLLYAMMPFLEEGDEVLVPDPSYPSNFLNPVLLGARTVAVPLDASRRYAIDIEEFERRVTDRTKMVVLTHPNNPTTTVFCKEDLEALARFVIAHDLVLVCDQAFEDHIFDGRQFVAPATLEGMWERTVTVCSVSKGLGLSGFRIGYIYAADWIMDVLYGGAVNVLGASATVTSIGAMQAIQETEYLASLTERHLRRRDLAYEVFSRVPGIRLFPSESGILTWIDVSRLGTSEEVVAYLLEHAKVLVNSGSAYGEQGKGFIRVVTGCFAEDSRAKEVFLRMATALTAMYGERQGENR